MHEIIHQDSKYYSMVRQMCPGAFAPTATRQDAGETLIIQRSLDHFEQKITKTMRAELRALRFVPMIGDIAEGEKTYTFAVQTDVGIAAPIAGRGKDLPRVDLSLSEHTSGIKPYGVSYAFTTQELRNIAAAAKRGVSINLESMRADLAAGACARFIDGLVAFGDPLDVRIRGFLNNAAVTLESAAQAWEDMTPEELLAELFLLANRQYIVSKEVFTMDTILLPTEHMTMVSTTYIGLTGTVTIMKAFKDAMAAAGRNVAVESWPLLALADAALTGPRAVAYKRDVDVVGAIVPMPFRAQPPQPLGLEWVVPCESECGGAAVKQPLGMYYRDGLDG